MNNSKAAIKEHWEGVDQLHRIVAALLVLGLVWTWWLGHPQVERPGWCANSPACGIGTATPMVPVAPVAPAVAVAPVAALPAPTPQIQDSLPPATTPTPTLPQPARVYFAVNDAQPPPQTTEELADLLAYLKADPAARASIVGFHDSSGNPAANNALAKARAQAVSALLVAAGVAASQLSLDKPMVIAESGTAAQARRVEVSIKP